MLTSFPNGISSYGVPTMGMGGIPISSGTYFFVNSATGSDGNDGLSMDRPLKTLLAAYNKCTTNLYDVIVLQATSSHYTLDTMLDWAKNRIHVVGLGTFGATDPQPEIQLSTAGNLLTVAATLKVTGFGNTFTNVYISNAGTGSALCVTALWDAGENNVYTNCQFAKFSDLNVAATSHVEARGDTSTFRNCRFGVEWITISAARFGLHIKGTGSNARMKHNTFEDCYFTVTTTTADYEHIHVYDTNSLAFTNTFKNCVFTNNLSTSLSAIACDDAVNSTSGLLEGTLFFINPAANSTSFTSVADHLTVVGHGMTSGAGTATVGVGITPN